MFRDKDREKEYRRTWARNKRSNDSEWRSKEQEYNRERYRKRNFKLFGKPYIYDKTVYSQEQRKRKYHLKSSYGISLEEFDKVYQTQEGCCKICGRERKLSVDHCHASGRIRGLLCKPCNSLLGWFENNRLSIQDYLTENKR